jgi:hypothetical protein
MEAKMSESVISLKSIQFPIAGELEVGDEVIFVVLGKVGVKVNDVCHIVPTTLMFDFGEFFEIPESLEDVDLDATDES